MSAPTHIFISPHFDDGVFSCGGAAHQLRQAGRRVIIMTMMGGLLRGPRPQSPILDDLHRRWRAGESPLRYRQREDKKAMAALSLDYVHVPLTDCVYRMAGASALYPSEESLFGPVHPADYAPSFLQGVDLPISAAGRVLYLPLAVGHHVDHQIVRAWGRRRLAEAAAGDAFRFYAEYPYSKADRATEAALADLGLDLRPVDVRLSEADMRAKIAAIACYQSQISTFWPDATAMAADVRRAFVDDERGGYVERFWEIVG